MFLSKLAKFLRKKRISNFSKLLNKSPYRDDIIELFKETNEKFKKITQECEELRKRDMI